MRYITLLFLLAGLATTPLSRAAEDHDHEQATASAPTGEEDHAEAHEAEHEDEHGHGDEGHEEGLAGLDAQRRAALGIVTAKAEMRALSGLISAPGEVTINAYRSSQVTPRISAQIIRRHARLGDHVRKGQPLVTLSSVAMAEAQGELMVADREWARVKKLGRKVVSERRYIEAEIKRQQAYARVRAYGMTHRQIRTLLKSGDVAKASGSFDLLSPQDGTVIRDDFIVGEMAEPGRILFEITDENTLWIEARLAPEDAARIALGSEARVSVDGSNWITGKVVQRHHSLDETTRTQSVRIELDNSADLLHPGQFVQVMLHSGAAPASVAVPSSAVLLMQGTPTVFKVEDDEIHPQPVETGITRGGYTTITSGLMTGEEVVVQGAFLLKSLLLKSQMGEGHAH